MSDVERLGDAYTPEAKARRRAHIAIDFQRGPVQEVGVNGCFAEDVIDLLVERLRGFQDGPFRCRENALAITALEEAGLWLLKRRMNRLEQGVEGYDKPHES